MARLRIVGLPHRLFPNKILSFALDAFLTFNKNCAIILPNRSNNIRRKKTERKTSDPKP